MRDPSRIDRIIEKLRAAWHASPDLRLGQLVETATIVGQNSERGRRDGAKDPFYAEDEWTERGFDKLLAHADKKTGNEEGS